MYFWTKWIGEAMPFNNHVRDFYVWTMFKKYCHFTSLALNFWKRQLLSQTDEINEIARNLGHNLVINLCFQEWRGITCATRRWTCVTLVRVEWTAPVWATRLDTRVIASMESQVSKVTYFFVKLLGPFPKHYLQSTFQGASWVSNL